VQSVERSGTTFTVIVPIRRIEKNENGLTYTGSR